MILKPNASMAVQACYMFTKEEILKISSSSSEEEDFVQDPLTTQPLKIAIKKQLLCLEVQNTNHNSCLVMQCRDIYLQILMLTNSQAGLSLFLDTAMDQCIKVTSKIPLNTKISNSISEDQPLLKLISIGLTKNMISKELTRLFLRELQLEALLLLCGATISRNL